MTEILWLKINKQAEIISCLKHTHFKYKVPDRVKVKDGKWYAMQPVSIRKFGVAVLVPKNNRFNIGPILAKIKRDKYS